MPERRCEKCERDWTEGEAIMREECPYCGARTYWETKVARTGMKQLTLAEFNAIGKDYRDVWTTERTDDPNWEKDRHLYMGKRTMLANENGATVLLIEGMSFEIVKE